MRTLIRDVRIFDGTGSPLRAGAVMVEGNRIVRVAQHGDELAEEAADRIIEGRGLTLMPGLVEAHAHLTWPSSVEKIYHQFVLPPEELKAAAWRNARVLLDHGFTSAYSAGALADGIEVELARAIERGETPGPRLIPSTIERSPEGAEGVETGNVFNGRGPDAMRAFVAFCKETGVGSLKLVVSGEDALKPGTSGDVLYTEAEMRAAGDAARDAGLWIAAHAYSPEAIRLALEAGARVLYHCSYADNAALDLLVAHKDSVFYAPGPGVSVGAIEATPPPHIDMTHMKASAAARLAREAEIVPALKARGMRILIGGDYGFPFNPNGRNARDLEHFVRRYGYTSAEALAAGTALGGDLMGLDVGQVKEGFLADLLLVDGDPTADVAILQDKTRLAMIMKDGKLHKAPEAVDA